MSRFDQGVAIALVPILGACNGVSETTTTPGDSDPTTTAGSPITTTTASTTSTSGTTTSTSIESAGLPVAQPDSPEWEVLYSKSAGPDGVTYEGGFDHWMLSGPQALAVGSDVRSE